MADFSSQSALYAKYRPTYPAALYEYIYSLVPAVDLAWDAGTGNGQVAVELASRFKRVIATDPSQQQLSKATIKPNIEYRREAAESPSIDNKSLDLITVAQAIHWFDFDLFYESVHRAAKPGGILAVFGYGLMETFPQLDQEVNYLYETILGNYWDTKRSLVEEQYQTIPFPFEELKPANKVMIEIEWTPEELLGYLSTWSAIQEYRKVHEMDPIEEVKVTIQQLLENKTVIARFPIFTMIARIS